MGHGGGLGVEGNPDEVLKMQVWLVLPLCMRLCRLRSVRAIPTNFGGRLIQVQARETAQCERCLLSASATPGRLIHLRGAAKGCLQPNSQERSEPAQTWGSNRLRAYVGGSAPSFGQICMSYVVDARRIRAIEHAVVGPGAAKTGSDTPPPCQGLSCACACASLPLFGVLPMRPRVRTPMFNAVLTAQDMLGVLEWACGKSGDSAIHAGRPRGAAAALRFRAQAEAQGAMPEGRTSDAGERPLLNPLPTRLVPGGPGPTCTCARVIDDLNARPRLRPLLDGSWCMGPNAAKQCLPSMWSCHVLVHGHVFLAKGQGKEVPPKTTSRNESTPRGGACVDEPSDARRGQRSHARR